MTFTALARSRVSPLERPQHLITDKQAVWTCFTAPLHPPTPAHCEFLTVRASSYFDFPSAYLSALAFNRCPINITE